MPQLHQIKFNDSLGRQVEISPVNGSGGNWHVYIDHYYIGQIFKRSGEWVCVPHNTEGIHGDDLQILADLVAAVMEKEKPR
ncbi:hypothetical protein [Paraflavitalea sp. CAU 1676]|uniref:hypothetical protein n=1 Tax=Paraflavitalea sp. CAU 1676 TaxID=3032598 RepID=UPI0023DCBD3F|nr:hypothetical protein [Paraflavitalea sp. CAU 1676]MDF2189266.1 hypothetical protein [Paraflavitalea sp. CAU 1676]